jgi:uncharacterized protein YegL
MATRKLSVNKRAKGVLPKQVAAPQPAKSAAPSPKRKAAGRTTHVCLVLDRSGSMLARRDDALGGVNTYIEDAKKKGSSLADSRFSLLTFNSNGIETPRKNLPISKIKPITVDDYKCDGWTPLYDAIAKAVELLDEALSRDPKAGKSARGGKAVLAIMTDGMENFSQEYNLSAVQEPLKQRQKGGWMVVFLGEGLDVAKQGLDIGARAANTVPYTAKGLRAFGGVLAMSASNYASTVDFQEQMGAASNAFTDEQKAKLKAR